MKHFLLGIGTFALIFVVMFGFIQLFETLQISKETTQIIFMVIALSFIAKPFGELTSSVFKLK